MPFISASFGKASSAKEAGLQRTVRLQPGVRVRRYFPRIQVTMGGIGFDSNGHLSGTLSCVVPYLSMYSMDAFHVRRKEVTLQMSLSCWYIMKLLVSTDGSI